MRKRNPHLSEFIKRFDLHFLNIYDMPKTIKSKLKPGEKLIGEVDELNNNNVVIKRKDESFVQLAVDDNLRSALEDDANYGDIVEISLNDDGDYVLTVHDEWPNEKQS